MKNGVGVREREVWPAKLKKNPTHKQDADIKKATLI